MRIATALVIFSVLGCGDRASQEQILQLPPWEPSVRIVDGSRPTVEFRKTPVLDLRNVVEATLRVGPDRRVLLAIPVIDTLSGGNASGEVALDFRDGSWVVRYKGAEIGRLSYLSGFDEAIDFLTRYAASLPRKAGMQTPASILSKLEDNVTGFSPEALVGALRIIDDQNLSLRDPRISRVASRAFTFLQLQSIDRAGLSDPMYARILACLAFHRAAGTGDDAEERALAADLMGYERDARRIAETLPEAHYLRRFISDKEVPDQPRSPLSIYVQTLQRVRNARITDENEDLEVLVASVFPLVSRSATRLVLEDTPFQSVMPSVFRTATIEELREITGIRTSGMSGWMETIQHRFGSRGGVGDEIEELEDVLGKAENKFRGKLFDAGTLRSYIEQNFYSGVWEEADNYLSALGSDEATKGFLESFGMQKRSRAAAEVQLWYDTARQLEYTRKDDKWLVERLPLFRKMSPHFRAALLESLATHNQGWHFDARTPAARLIGELDSRPGELEDAAMLSRSFLSDQKRWERYRTAAFEASASDGWWFFHQTGQYPKVLEYASDRTRDFAERGMAVLYLFKSGQLDESAARQRFNELLADPASGGFFRAYGLFLNETGDMVTKQKSVEKWIENHPDAEGLTIAWHNYVLSNSLERQGKYKEAYAVIAPYLHYWSANVVLQTASVLQRIGKPNEAIALGNQAIERYGDSVRDEVAPILWRERRYAEAAQMLNAEKYVISSKMTTETIPGTKFWGRSFFFLQEGRPRRP